ncbi:hypothetical protein [Marinibactrum halimedae]|uniref:Uncharacterized protein n=1 Tax=Marinibactrum halimedae TaxID=1444977 RepID=A0AA37T0P0_9GAMM|nr:hypothetical protein [Marinibactrum halimedae]MCD9461127.1 hypothetical protein [Marinibactrum halimedae]GLS24645.1 hypothetical protein GCM10007877_03590 [Marinibactrum halimedae]
MNNNKFIQYCIAIILAAHLVGCDGEDEHTTGEETTEVANPLSPTTEVTPTDEMPTGDETPPIDTAEPSGLDTTVPDDTAVADSIPTPFPTPTPTPTEDSSDTASNDDSAPNDVIFPDEDDLDITVVNPGITVVGSGNGGDNDVVVDAPDINPDPVGVDDNSTPEVAGVLMPIEVLGSEGLVVRRDFELDETQVNAADKIYFYANNLSYENKGSIRVNNGKWVSLNHTDVDVYEKEMAYGGMQHGGFNSIRFTLPATNLKQGSNTLRFRFDESDGISMGYRIFKMNLLNRNGKSILPKSFFEEDDPRNWRAPEGYGTGEAIKAGERLWRNATLVSHYLPEGRVARWYGNELLPATKMKATCSDCHTQDGRDLAYFSYSNHSIIERAKFHKLSADQGKKIAAYIRSLDVPSHGRPWNPPYQPGKVLDNRPVSKWAAGAGIEAVLEEDAEMLPLMFPDGTSQVQVDRYFDANKMYDTTTMPVSIQFPDWKHWLPLIHPKDAYGQYWETTSENLNPGIQYGNLRDYLERNRGHYVADKDNFYRQLGKYWRSFRGFYTEEEGVFGNWRVRDAVADRYLPSTDPGFAQMARTSLARLLAVKNFEIHQEFKLEKLAPKLVDAGDQPAERQWITGPKVGYNVFEVPPHFTSCFNNKNNHCNNFIGQPHVTGRFETTVWYELQLVLNPGNGWNSANGPVDYNYVPPFILNTSKHSGRPEPLRYYRAINSMYQTKSWSGDKDPKKRKGFRIRQQGPWLFYGYTDAWGDAGFEEGYWVGLLDELEPGLSVKFINALLGELNRQLHRPTNHPDTYNRKEPNLETQLDPIEKALYEKPKPGKFGWADRFYYLVPKFEAMGVNKNRLNRMIDWCEIAWPNMNWKEVRPSSE